MVSQQLSDIMAHNSTFAWAKKSLAVLQKVPLEELDTTGDREDVLRLIHATHGMSKDKLHVDGYTKHPALVTDKTQRYETRKITAGMLRDIVSLAIL